MAGTRQRTEIADRRAKVADLYLRGQSQNAIARRLKVSQATVSVDLAAVREEWKVRAAADFSVWVADALARVDRLELEAWSAWKESVGKVTKRVEKSEPREAEPPEDGQPPARVNVPVEVTVTTEELAGDPRFLAQVHKCIERRCVLLGLDAPKRVDVTSGGLPITKVVSPEVIEGV